MKATGYFAANNFLPDGLAALGTAIAKSDYLIHLGFDRLIKLYCQISNISCTLWAMKLLITQM